MSIKAMKQALKFLKKYDDFDADEIIEELSQAIEQAEKQEFVAWKHDCAALLQNGIELWIDRCPHCGKPRNTPPQREWVGLNPETDFYDVPYHERYAMKVAETILKRRNHG